MVDVPSTMGETAWVTAVMVSRSTPPSRVTVTRNVRAPAPPSSSTSYTATPSATTTLQPLDDEAIRQVQFRFQKPTAEFANQVAPDHFNAVKVGAAPYFDLKVWNPRGDSAKNLRAGVNQARRAGVEVRYFDDADEQLRKETAELCLRWLGTHRAATTFGWLIALDPFLHSEYKKYFAARAEGKLVGFVAASPIPTRKGWYLEDVISAPDAPQGTATLLVVEALNELKSQGASLATLGTSPLASDGANDLPTNRVIARALEMAARRLGSFYNFEGLRRFKSKFVPTWWESEYALAQHGVAIPPRVGHAIVRALVPGGLTQLLTRQAIRAIKGGGE